MTWLSFACCYLALAAGGLAMNVHHRRVFQRDPSPRARLALRVGSLLLFSASASLSMVACGGAVGLVTTVAMTAFCGLLFSMLLTLAPRWLGLPALLLLLASLA